MINYFNYGIELNLPSIENIDEIRAYVTVDEQNLYFDINGERIKITDIIELNDISELPETPTNNFYYIKSNNTLNKYNGSQWIVISGGITDYNDLTNHPSINGIALIGNKTLDSLGIASKDTLNKIIEGEITVPNAESAVAALVAASATNATLISGKDLDFLLDYNNLLNVPIVDTKFNSESNNAIANSTVNSAITSLSNELSSYSTNFSNSIRSIQETNAELQNNISNIQSINYNNFSILPLNYSYSNSTHILTNSNENYSLSHYQAICFMPTQGYSSSNSITIDGVSYTLKMQDGSEIKDGLWAANTLVSATLDTINHTINFKSGGGISLEQLTNQASAAQIINGYSAYDHEGNVVTGSALNTATTATAAEILTPYTAYNNSGVLITGTMADKSKTPNYNPASSALSGSYYRMQIPTNGYYTTSNYLQVTKSSVANIILSGGSGTAAAAAQILSGHYAWNKSGALLQGTYSPPKLSYGTFKMPTYTTLAYDTATVTVNCGFQPTYIFIQDYGDGAYYFLMYSDFANGHWHIGIDTVSGTIGEFDGRGPSHGGNYPITRSSTGFTFNYYPIGCLLIAAWNGSNISISGHTMRYIAIG